MSGQAITIGETNITTETKSGVTATYSNGSISVTSAAGATSTSFTIKCGSAQAATLSVTVNAVSKSATLTPATSEISVNGTQQLTLNLNGYTLGTDYDSITWNVTQNASYIQYMNSTTTNYTTVTGLSAGTATVSASLMKTGVSAPVYTTNSVTVTVKNVAPVYITVGNNVSSSSTLSLAGIGSEATLTAHVTSNPNIYTGYTYTWQRTSGTSVSIVEGNYSNYYQQTVRAVTAGTTTVAVSIYSLDNATTPIGTAYIDITVGNSGLLVSATINGSSDYQLSSLDDNGKISIYDQICNAVSNTSINRRLYSVTFLSTTNVCGDLENASAYNGIYYADTVTTGGARLSQLVFTPKQAGTARFSFYAYYSDWNNTPTQGSYLTGTLEIKVDSTVTTGDIPYTASIGDDVYFDIGDFEDFYYTKTSRGTLDRVAFTLPSGGNLYADGGRLSSNNVCYASPRNNQNDLSTVYFSPTGTTASRAGTVRISFTAYGNKNSVSGTVAITYLNGAAKDINYSAINGTVTLNPQDFINAYRDVTGKTAPSSLTIQFQEAPVNGTLTYTGGSRDMDLTRNNIRSNKYSTKTTGSYRLDQLVYSGTRGTDTIEYIAYSGSAAQFAGKVVFNGAGAVPTDVVVRYGSTGGQSVTFSQNDFILANSAISNAAKLRFVASSNGALTMNGANAAGVDVLPSMLGSVSYKPRAGFNGTDKIIFAAYDARGNVVASGNVNITVVGNSGGSTGGSTGAGGVTDVSQFKDVSSSAWYRNDLATLVSQGIITGKGEGKFDPLGTVTYGEALKMILEACGHTAALGTGSNWAINYKNLAVSTGWISSSIDLNAAMSRNATAELAAKVLGVAQATGSSPFADDANAYAVALYYTNPQIFVGDNTTGKLLFKNGSPLLRQEVCAVICRIRNYHTQHTTNTMPDGL